jgi:hypothetical protein
LIRLSTRMRPAVRFVLQDIDSKRFDVEYCGASKRLHSIARGRGASEQQCHKHFCPE